MQAPRPRALGKSAAEGPNDRLQADLIDFSQNTRGKTKYGLVVMDVFTREAAVEPLQNKNAETVGRATKRAAKELTGDDGNFVVTTDLGNEFATLDRELPAEAVRRTKRPEDRNAIAVVDRGIQTLKKDLATRVARKGGQWSDHFKRAAGAYNARPHETVHGAPKDVEKQPATEFRVLQDNADKFQHNKDLTDRRVKAVEDAGAFRAPTNAARSFKVRRRAAAGGRGLHDRPQHGGALLKLAPAPQGSGNAADRLTRRGRPAAVRQLDDFLGLRGPGPSTNLKMIFLGTTRPPCVQGTLIGPPFGAKKPRKKGFETLRRLGGNSRSLLKPFFGSGFGVLGKPTGWANQSNELARANRAKPCKCPCVRVWGAQDTKKYARPAKVLLRQVRQVRQVRQPIKFNKTANRMLVLCLSHLSHLSQRRLPHQKTTAKLAGFVLVSLVSVVSTEDFKKKTIKLVGFVFVSLVSLVSMSQGNFSASEKNGLSPW